MAKFISQVNVDPVIENQQPGVKQEPDQQKGSKTLKTIMEDRRKFGRDLKNVAPTTHQNNLKGIPIKEEKNDPLNVSFKPILIDNQVRDPSVHSKGGSRVVKIKPSTPSKQFLTNRNSLLFSESHRESFANDIKKYIGSTTAVDRKDTNLQRDDPQQVNEYSAEIFAYLRQNDRQNIPKPGYMKFQMDINEKMRAILIDWLVSVCLKMSFKDESLFLTINIIDRYLSTEQVSKSKLQLIGISALLIACKYEEIYPPYVEKLIELTDNTYTRDEVLDAERQIIGVLNFRLTFASANLFIEKYSEAIGLDKKGLMLAKYMIELAMIEFKMLKYTPSMVAASAVNLSCKLLGIPGWSSKMTSMANYIEAQLINCMKDLLYLNKYSRTTSLSAVRDKYGLEKFCKVSKIAFFP